MSAKATVTLTVEITLSNRWGADCTLGQVEAQAARMATDILATALAKSTDGRIAMKSVGPVTTTIIPEPTS